MQACDCHVPTHVRKRIVLTGGPGAGKTAVLELVRQYFCRHVVVLSEAASILFGGGFPRGSGAAQMRATQRAIFFVQRELEAIADAVDNAALIVCDRGTVDGAAYWPDDGESFWASVNSTLAGELTRYAAVIHLRTPGPPGYNQQNPIRIESAIDALKIDNRITEVWRDHPCRYVIPARNDFLGKAKQALQLVYRELPECCRGPLGSPFEDLSGASSDPAV